jgi:hypothetical protein
MNGSDQMDRQSHKAIRASLREIDSYANRSEMRPFARPGWLQDLFTWAQEQLNPLGLQLKGGFRQLKASPTCSLVRLETDGPAVWFKATGEPNLHELPITVCLARLFPGNVPTVLGVHPLWNGWLSEEVSGGRLDKSIELSDWERVARDFAEVQIASIGKDTDLLKAQCKDLRLLRLSDLIEPLLDRAVEFMAVQTKKNPQPLTDHQLSFLGAHLTESCLLLQGLGFPDTLAHIDFNPRNIVVSDGCSVFLDWAEGSITFPLVTLEYLLEYSRRANIDSGAISEKITASYLRPWQALLSSDAVDRAMSVSPLVAVFAYALADPAWCSPETLHDSKRLPYLRSLTRRMYREAVQSEERGTRCTA